MSIAIVFWILMLIWLVFWGVVNWPTIKGPATGNTLLLFVLLGLLGWKTFGPPIHG